MKFKIQHCLQGVVIGLLIIVGITSHLSIAEAEVFKLVINDYCPYSCDPSKEDGKMGYLSDLVIAIFERAGYTVNTERLPFSRSIIETRAGKYDAITGAYKEDTPDFVFPDTEQGFSVNVFYTLKSTSWRYTGQESLLSIETLGLGDYEFPSLEKFIQQHPEKIIRVKGMDPVAKIIKMMEIGHVQVSIDDRLVIRYTLQKLGIADKFIEVGEEGEPNPLYIVFSPANPKSPEYARLLSEGIAELRKSGELTKIMGKYGLQDWAIPTP